MHYTQEMMLQSTSGYCMPFEERDKDVEMSLGYGRQKHPQTGEMFFHHGIDFKARRYILAALATGTVSGIGSDAVHGVYQVIRYGDYEVTYSHLSNVFVNFGQNGNVFTPEFVTIDLDVHNMYDKDQKEVEDLMMRFYPSYMEDMLHGAYTVPKHTEQALRNIFTVSAMKEYFYETLPSMANPLGMGARSIPLAEKVQNLLIGDFLNYLALRHQIFLSSLSTLEKKKPKT